jgi:hypothetical protein
MGRITSCDKDEDTLYRREYCGRRGKRDTIVRAAIFLFIIGAVIVAGCTGFNLSGTGAGPQGQTGFVNASGSNQVSPPPTHAGTPAGTAATETVPLKVPVTVRSTIAPINVAGVVSWPHINPDTASGTIERNYTFKFQDRMVTVSAVVDKSVYNGAKNGEKSVMTNRQGLEKRDWAPGYFYAFVNDEHQEKFYASLLESLRKTRQEMNLSDDEYLELMAVFVQSLEYDTARSGNLESGNRFPVETFVDGIGVCGDKSLLLAGLLTREGYDISLFLFEPEAHMALGVRSDSNGYRNTSYAYLETTKLSFVGIVPDNLAGGIVLTSMPQVIPLSDGGRKYTATPETFYIRDQYKKAEERVINLEAEIKSSELGILQYNEKVTEHNRYATLFNYISTHAYDRPGTYDYVVAHAITPPDQLAARSALPGPAYAACDPGAGLSCPADSRCCEADHTCYTPCSKGVWQPDSCVCQV